MRVLLPEHQLENKVFIKVFQTEVDISIRLVNEKGKELPCANRVLSIRSGVIHRPCCIDREGAKQAGLVLDASGRIKLELTE